jgi:hypothetical protein
MPTGRGSLTALKGESRRGCEVQSAQTGARAGSACPGGRSAGSVRSRRLCIEAAGPPARAACSRSCVVMVDHGLAVSGVTPRLRTGVAAVGAEKRSDLVRRQSVLVALADVAPAQAARVVLVLAVHDPTASAGIDGVKGREGPALAVLAVVPGAPASGQLWPAAVREVADPRGRDGGQGPELLPALLLRVVRAAQAAGAVGAGAVGEGAVLRPAEAERERVLTGPSGYYAARHPEVPVRLPLLTPQDLVEITRSLAGALRSLGQATAQAEALVPRLDDFVTRGDSLLGRAEPAVDALVELAPQLPSLAGRASKVMARAEGALTADRVNTGADLVDRLGGALTASRVQDVAEALDAISARAVVVPRLLDGINDLLKPARLKRLTALVDRLLASDQIDRVSRLLTRAEQLLDDGRLERLLDRLDTLLADDRIDGLVDRLDGTLTDERISRLDALTSNERIALLEQLTPERVEAAAQVFQRLDGILTAQRAESFQALGDHLSDLLTSQRADTAGRLLDEVPRFLSALHDGDLPTSRELRQVPPDLHALLELLDEINQVVSGLPGAGRARDRGDDPHPQVVPPTPTTPTTAT